ncbi:19561_t:CDS:2 [Entrophospora sp. SA101]|nr:19561_t:CDS:2 [Entrophospora sp. SA101]
MNKLSTTLKGYYKHKSKKSSSNGEKFINKFKSGICSVCGEKFTEKNWCLEYVVLKRPHNDQISNPEFLKEQVSVYLYASSKDSSIIKCLGFTLHPTEGYMLVFEYAEEGDLRGYLNANYSNLTWIDKISILRDLATGQTPFLNYNDDGNLVNDIINGKHFEALSNNKNIPKDYIDLMKKCWELEPTNRPSFQVIVTKIGEWMSSPSKHFSTKKSKPLESTDKAIKKESRSIIRLPFSRNPSPLASNDNNSKNNGKTKSKNTNSNVSSIQRFNSLSSKSLSKYVQQLEDGNNNIDDINVRYNDYYDNSENDIKINNYISKYYGNNNFNNYSNDNQFAPAFNGNYLFK